MMEKDPVSSSWDASSSVATLTKSLASATLGTPVAAPDHVDQPAAAAAAASTGATGSPTAGHDPGVPRRRRGRAFRVPTDYLRVGQESRDRRRRRALARRCIVRLCSVHSDRATERGLSAMMARLMTTTSAGGDGDTGAASASAAAPSEHAGLGELLEKLVVSIKD